MQLGTMPPTLTHLPPQQRIDITAAAITEKIREQARGDLIKYAQYIDPAQREWYRAKHLRKIADALERVQQRQSKRVIISLPPRHWKSSLAVKWESKLLGDDPKEKIINASRALSLALKFSKQVRRILQSERYQALYPDTRILRGSDSADDWLLERGYQSSYRAVGTGGGIAGEGATILVLDDVSDPNKQSSETETTNDWDWYKDVIRTRLEPNGVIVVINNRVGQNDLVGYLLDPERNDSADPPEDWEQVIIPALDEVGGTFLWEDRFGVEYYQKLQNDARLWRIQYQQKASVVEGTLIKREWFERILPDGQRILDVVPELPAGAVWKVRPIDAAFTAKETEKHDPDFTATCKMCFFQDVVWIGEPRMFRKGIDETVTEIVSMKIAEPHLQMGMGRVAIRAKIIKALLNAGYNITEYPETGDPVAESTGWRNIAATGRLKLVGTVEEWEKIMAYWTAFPGGHDDTIAMVSIGYDMLGNPLVSRPPNPNATRRLPIVAAAQRHITQQSNADRAQQARRRRLTR